LEKSRAVYIVEIKPRRTTTESPPYGRAPSNFILSPWVTLPFCLKQDNLSNNGIYICIYILIRESLAARCTG
jgi:hypothetical protein